MKKFHCPSCGKDNLLTIVSKMTTLYTFEWNEVSSSWIYTGPCDLDGVDDSTLVCGHCLTYEVHNGELESDLWEKVT